MLSPETIRKIKKVHIKSSRTVNTMMAGQYKSVFRGSGIEFEEVREYSPGDEVKSIDWKVSARLGKPFVKLYREERELVVMLLVDMSASGRFGTRETTKQEIAAEIASILAFSAVRNNDKVGAILFTSGVEKYIPPKKGATHVWRVIREIFSFEPVQKGTDIQNAVSYLGKVCRKRAVVFLISDFLSPDYSKRLRVTSRKHELIGMLVSDPGDFTLPAAGILSVQDFETGRQVLLDASDQTTRRRFFEHKTAEYRSTLQNLKSAVIDCVEVSTGDPAAEVLINYFRRREKRKR